LERKTGSKHSIVDEETCDIRADLGMTYEHKADRQAHRTRNVAFEAYDGKGRERWLFACNADYLVVTSRRFIRVYRWRGGMKDCVIEHMNGKYLKYRKTGGDDDRMVLWCIPEWRLRRFLEVEEPWDNQRKG
jgi:hypothetical protein